MLDGFIAAHKALLAPMLAKAKMQGPFRVLFSAHGLPQRIVDKGDPYPWQVQQSVEAIIRALGEPDLDWRICYQSRVGPLAWLEPSTEAEIDKAGAEKKGLIVVPIAFVSEHSETLVELDLDYAARAKAHGVPFYLRVPTLGVQPAFIEALAKLALDMRGKTGMFSAGDGRICPPHGGACPAGLPPAAHAA
jgi:ferrochelatase